MSNQEKAKQVELFYTPKRLNGDLAVYQYGHHKCPNSHFYGPSKREYYLFHFIVKGKGVYKCGGKEYLLEKGMGFLIKPGEETFYQADENEPWEYYFVAFHGMMAQKIVKEIVWTDGYIFNAEDEDSVKRCIKKLCRDKKDYAWSEYQVLGELYVLLAELIRQKSLKTETAESKRKETALEQAVAYLRENATSAECSVQGIAKHVNMDRTNLYRLFKKRFGISIMQYLRNYRMDQALTLLQSTDLPAKVIAEKVGMPDYPHFCKTFKEYNGHSPLEYRNRYRAKHKRKKETKTGRKV